MINQYDAFEIHPCQVNDEDGELISLEDFEAHRRAIAYYEQCDEDDPDIYCWSVYGHLPELRDSDGHITQCGVECLADCPTKEIAEYIREALFTVLNMDHI